MCARESDEGVERATQNGRCSSGSSFDGGVGAGRDGGGSVARDGDGCAAVFVRRSGLPCLFGFGSSAIGAATGLGGGDAGGDGEGDGDGGIGDAAGGEDEARGSGEGTPDHCQRPNAIASTIASADSATARRALPRRGPSNATCDVDGNAGATEAVAGVCSDTSDANEVAGNVVMNARIATASPCSSCSNGRSACTTSSAL